ncbi:MULTISPECIES: FMN-binding protein [unclassified Streptomyces]|uniref:FMN-binding protein n=1 Tax=unclassified Streptomyces TaxID=2593676 RepID=UPI0004C13FA6|nr:MULTISPECIES: FMN-binding protein [unclassified Streptomyces]
MHALRKDRPLRRIVLASAATVSGTVLLLALKPQGGQSAAGAAAPAPSVSSAPSAAPAPSASGAGGRAVTGGEAQTRWGPVQVKVTVSGGRVTDVTAVEYPTENPRDQQINSYALPQLRTEALAAQSADIDTVSGATYTSEGYKQSLQSALDAAGL